MGAPAAVLQPTSYPAAVTLRTLHLWHLLSLDAPTVALCWALLFSVSARVPHAWTTACTLACAVWLVYAGDRLLDARRQPHTDWNEHPEGALCRVYRQHARPFVTGAAMVATAVMAMLFALPNDLREAWLLLGLPLALYAAAVHVLRLDGRWKAVCVGIFFASAVALPVVVHGGVSWPVLLGAVAFGGVCRANCAVLRGTERRQRLVLLCSMVATLLAASFGETRAIATACAAALILMVLLLQKRVEICNRLGWLTWRALVDAALVAPAVVVVLGMYVAR